MFAAALNPPWREVNDMTSCFATMEDCVISAMQTNGEWMLTRHLEESSPLCIASEPSGSRIYVGTLDDCLFRSTDLGDSWEVIGQEISSRRITALTVDSKNRIWAGTEPTKIYRSDDGGTHGRRERELTISHQRRNGVTPLDQRPITFVG